MKKYLLSIAYTLMFTSVCIASSLPPAPILVTGKIIFSAGSSMDGADDFEIRHLYDPISGWIHSLSFVNEFDINFKELEKTRTIGTVFILNPESQSTICLAYGTQCLCSLKLISKANEDVEFVDVKNNINDSIKCEISFEDNHKTPVFLITKKDLV